MVKIILILALLQYIINFIFGYKSNILSCGIFGQASNKPENLDVNGVHILGIYNIERGKMSCGLSWDGDVQYGIGFDKLYTDFIVDRKIEPIKTPIMIGHTRQPSYGMAITEDNAHPFGFGTSNDGEGFEMIFCHNGTLKNHKDLAKKYDIELSEKVTKMTHGNHSYETTRQKIDSEILGEILYKTKKFHVLSEYIGAAALAWTWIDEPNKLYLWSGASKQTAGSNLADVEERPMNVFCKDNNSMFFSSIDKSLTVLGAPTNTDLQIDYNTVYIITDGDFANAEKHKLSRKNAGQSEAIVYNTGKHYSTYGRGSEDYCDLDNYSDERKATVNSSTSNTNKTSSLTNLKEEKTIKPIVEYGSRVYFKSLRYWSKGVLTDGVYVYIKNYGFRFLGNTLASANAYYKQVEGISFNSESGTFNFNFVPVNVKKVIPFEKDSTPPQFHYFVDGVMLRSLCDYNAALSLKAKLPAALKNVSSLNLSYLAKHPVIDIHSTTSTPLAMLDGKVFTGNIVELGFEKVYYFTNGLLSKWSKREDLDVKKDPPVIILPAVNSVIEFDNNKLKEAVNNIKDFEKENVENNKCIEDELFIKELIMESFEKHSEEVSETILELSDWKDNDLVKGAMETLKLISHTLKEFVEIPNKK